MSAMSEPPRELAALSVQELRAALGRQRAVNTELRRVLATQAELHQAELAARDAQIAQLRSQVAATGARIAELGSQVAVLGERGGRPPWGGGGGGGGGGSSTVRGCGRMPPTSRWPTTCRWGGRPGCFRTCWAWAARWGLWPGCGAGPRGCWGRSWRGSARCCGRPRWWVWTRPRGGPPVAWCTCTWPA